jgi:hypothetical protein
MLAVFEVADWPPRGWLPRRLAAPRLAAPTSAPEGRSAHPAGSAAADSKKYRRVNFDMILTPRLYDGGEADE